MKFISSKIKYLLLIAVFLFFTHSASAQESIGITVTPPLIKINMEPGQTWSSFIKVVNQNPNPLEIYTDVMDFKSGKTGGVEFFSVPREEGVERVFLSQWIKISSEPITIPPFQSKEIPFEISVPENAAPGGHYAAILAGTKPPETSVKGTVIKISSLVSSLILLNVKGEIIEKGWIREFSTEKTFYQKPQVKFKMSFENLGNVHLHPVGQIEIYNMWGKKRGKIPINQKSHFGNVLPQSTRSWQFEWKGEESPFEIGRYKAELVLDFGEEAHQTVSRTIYFWIIPLASTVGILGGTVLSFLIIFLGIRTYIKRSIELTVKQVGLEIGAKPKRIEITLPIKEAIIDLRKSVSTEKGFRFLLKKYYKFLLIMLLIFFWGGVIFTYFGETLKPEKSFEIIQTGAEGQTAVSSGEIFKKETKKIIEPEIEKKAISITILNGSGISKAAAETAKFLENQGFSIEKVGNAESFNYQKTLIKYKPGREKEAEKIKKLLKVEAELKEVKEQKEEVIVIIGKDLNF